MSNPSSQEKARVALIVEDDDALRELLRIELESDGLTVFCATDGEAAISMAQRLRPDAILMDIELPKINGFEATKIIKNNLDTRHIPILMLTVADRKKDIIRGLEAGAIDYVTKPFFVPEFRARINSVIKYKRLYDDLDDVKDRLIQSEKRYRLLVENASDAIMVLQDGMFKFGNDNAVELLRSSKANLACKPLLEFVHPDDREAVSESELKISEGGKLPHVYTLRIIDKDKKNKWMEIKSTPIIWEGKPATLNFLSDVTERKRAEEEIRLLAYYDCLTGLPNRLSFQDSSNRALASAKRRGLPAAVLFLDLDDFKKINDSFGHTVGDLLLKGVADRLAKALRKSDIITRQSCGDGSSELARLGGDEFVILLTDIKRPDDAANVAQRIRYTLSDTFVLAGHEIVITASIGVSLYPTDGEDIDTLIKQADKAMYYAKAQGRDTYQFSRDSSDAATVEKFPSEDDLRKALEDKELALYFQPQVEIKTGQISGMEALIRWRHPERGLVSPAEFIPVAEETGLSLAIAEWVLNTGCLQNTAWEKAGFGPLRMGVNLSSYVLKEQDLIGIVSRILDDTGLLPHCLELEVNESMLMQNEKEVLTAMKELKAMGVRLSIDDFGSGYCSLSYLKRFPLDSIKIDRSVIKDIIASSDNKGFITAVVAMAHALELRVVAVGVETEDQLDFLREQGCDEVQGYLLSPPMPSASITEVMRSESIWSARVKSVDDGLQYASPNISA